MNGKGSFFSRFRLVFFLAAVVALLVDIFVIRTMSDLSTFIVGLISLTAILGGKIKRRKVTLLAIGFWLVSLFFLLLGGELLAEKMAVWGYFFLLLSVVKGMRRKND